MRKALVVGIDFYPHIGGLSGCVHDAGAVANVLARHSDGSVNFAQPKVLAGSGPANTVTRAELKEAIRELFSGDSDIALFYLAGHGFLEDTGGFLCTSESTTGDEGLALHELMAIANASNATNKVIILDSCHSGAIGSRPGSGALAEIKEGMTLLSASTADQYSMEVDGGGAGVFTTLLVDALSGSAANLVGEITPGSVYAHIDQSLGPWSQRPVFKTNVNSFVSLRRAQPPISLEQLQALARHFPTSGHRFKLDPSYEPERPAIPNPNKVVPPPDPAKTAVFAVLQNYVKVNLVRPVGAPHMWHAAMESKSCELTVLREHYRKLVAAGLI